MIIKVNAPVCIENIDPIMKNIHSIISLTSKLINLRYNENLKSKPGREFYICLFQIDTIYEHIRSLLCCH